MQATIDCVHSGDVEFWADIARYNTPEVWRAYVHDLMEDYGEMCMDEHKFNHRFPPRTANGKAAKSEACDPVISFVRDMFVRKGLDLKHHTEALHSEYCVWATMQSRKMKTDKSHFVNVLKDQLDITKVRYRFGSAKNATWGYKYAHSVLFAKLRAAGFLQEDFIYRETPDGPEIGMMESHDSDDDFEEGGLYIGNRKQYIPPMPPVLN